MSLQILVVGGGDDFGLDRTLEVGHFLGPLVNQQHQHVDFRMVGSDGVGDLLENRGFARARRRDNQPAGAFADRGNHVNHPGFDQVRRGFQLEFLDRVNGCQVLKANRFGVIIEPHAVDLIDGFELRARAAMRRLRGADDQAPSRRKFALYRVRRDKDVRRFRVKMILGCAEETKTFLRDFKVTGTGFLSVLFIIVFAHTTSVVEDFENTRNFEF